MKKMLKNQKGFSLIELLIVIAIMGVLAVIAFSMFSGVLANSKKNADKRQADNIQKALIAYMVDTGDVELTSLKNGATPINGSAVTTFPTTVNAQVNNLILALQQRQTVNSHVFEPYLNPSSGGSPSSADFAPQWAGNGGYHVKIWINTMNATVEPVVTGGGNLNNIIFNQ